MVSDVYALVPGVNERGVMGASDSSNVSGLGVGVGVGVGVIDGVGVGLGDEGDRKKNHAMTAAIITIPTTKRIYFNPEPPPFC